jgi:hypothetical protein
MAYAEETNSPLCVISLDFKGAFDNVSHEYLFAVLQKYGFSTSFQAHIQSLYHKVKSHIQIHGYRSPPIEIRSSIRQGCPLSMLLYAICLNHFLCALHEEISGIQLGSRNQKTAVIAYADDVTILAIKPAETLKIRELITQYEDASGARINIHKSKAIALG